METIFFYFKNSRCYSKHYNLSLSLSKETVYIFMEIIFKCDISKYHNLQLYFLYENTLLILTVEVQSFILYYVIWCVVIL